MKNGREKFVQRVLLFTLLSFLIVLVGFIFSLHVLIPKKLKQQLLQLPEGFEIHYSGIHTDLFASTITLDNVDLSANPDINSSRSSHRFHFHSLKFQKINFLKLATSRNLSVNSIELDSANIFLDSILLAGRDSIKWNAIELPFKKLTVEKIILPSATIYIHSAYRDKLAATGDIALTGIQNMRGKQISVKDINLKLSNIFFDDRGQSLQIGKLSLDSREQKLKIDSAKLLSGNKLMTSVGSIEIDKFERDDSIHLTVGNFFVDHLQTQNVQDFKNLKQFSQQLAGFVLIKKLTADHLRFGNTGNPESNGRIELSNLQFKIDSTNSPQDLKFSDLACEFTNPSIAYGSSVLSAKYFYVDSKKEELKIEKLKIENQDKTETSVDNLSLRRFDLNNLLHKKLIAGGMDISGVKTTASITNLSSPGNLLPGIIKIANLNATGVDISQLKKFPFSCTAKIKMQDLLIEQAGENFSLERIKFSNIYSELDKIRTTVPGEMHNITIDKLSIDSRDKSIVIHSLKTIPQFNKFEYARKRGFQGNWVKSSIPLIKIADADISSLFQRKLIAGKMIISGADIYVFRDRRLPRKLRNQKLPVAFMKTLPIDLRISSVTVEPGRVVYEEQPNYWIHTGTLKLEKMQMTLSPLINHPTANDPAYIEMKATGSVMGSGSANAYFKMPLRDNDIYFVKGSFQNLSLPTLNSTAENLGDFSIRSGLLNFLNFEFTMSAQRANGKIVGAYHNLVVDKIKIDRKDSTRKEKAGFSSFVLHHVIIPKDKDASLPLHRRTGKVDYPRDPTRFVTYYFIKSLLDGVRSSFTFGFVLPK